MEQPKKVTVRPYDTRLPKKWREETLDNKRGEQSLAKNGRSKFFIRALHADPMCVPLEYMSMDEFEAEVKLQLEVGTQVNEGERTAFCMPCDFGDPDINRAKKKAEAINLYIEYGGNWLKVFNDYRGPRRSTVALWMMDDQFKAKIWAADEVVAMEAKGVVVEVMHSSLDDRTRLAAALRFLEYQDAKNWDKGIRKQIVANKGAIQSELLRRDVSDKEMIEFYLKEQLSGAPQHVKQMLLEYMGGVPGVEKPKVLDAMAKEVADYHAAPGSSAPRPSDRIEVANMADLKDPFTNENEEPK